MKRGDIVLADLRGRGPRRNEVAKTRPVVLFQTDRLGPDILDTVIVLPLTTQRFDEIRYLRIPIPARQSLKQDSWVIPEQILSIDRHRLLAPPVARMSHEELATAERIVGLILQLR